ncbi:sodium-dependent transporter [[Clostridium] polysaccharolyticum]|uniref:Transporter n=1 Tax=[Clostridium] polysaccharolyticum TaxID=29364 RepID=A0A1I0CIX5_9FIRM|nr:sodium-dependent transporter [[Clostridium] polysaccharolyticum]SET19567.1 neurotransmitter:Na+ symporter, NSS family [[Clostridium] polysaccharolyticum]
MEREKFSSRLGFILVSAGCAIGLGNVWKFPYICGENGGAAFILIYLACLVLLGLPVLICEFAVGRGSKRSLATAYNTLEPEGTKWHHFKWLSVPGNYLLMMFYTMVGGWMLYYAYVMATGKLKDLSPDEVGAHFGSFTNSPAIMTLFTIIAIILSFSVCALGVQNGVEKITKIMMVLLIGLMVVLAANSLHLSGASKGIRFYLVPDFTKLKAKGIGNVVFAAMTHAFFTISVGIGSMEIFGSYLSRDRKLANESLSIVILDTFVALTAGLIIIPACFAFGVQPDSGPSLLFITLPNVFNKMEQGRIWGTLFFVFMSFAALSTIIAVFENIVSMTMELGNMSRKRSVWLNCIAISILSMPAILGFNVLSGFHPIGTNSAIMDLEDFLVSYNILPLGSLIIVLFCVKKNGWGFENFLKEANNGKGITLSKAFQGYLAFFVPALIVAVYLRGYYDFFKKFSKAAFIFWMCFAVTCLLVVFRIALFTGIRKKADI